MDTTRFDLFGRWSGTIRTPEGEINGQRRQLPRRQGPQLGRAPDRRARDRRRAFGRAIRGIFPVGAAVLGRSHQPGDHLRQHRRQAADPRGDGRAALQRRASGPDAEDGRDWRLATAATASPITRAPGWPAAPRSTWSGTMIALRTIAFEPLLTFYMKGIGYTHPEWGHAYWKGELATGHESFDPASARPVADRQFPHPAGRPGARRNARWAGRARAGGAGSLCARRVHRDVGRGGVTFRSTRSCPFSRSANGEGDHAKHGGLVSSNRRYPSVTASRRHLPICPGQKWGGSNC